jgi:DNA-binding protein H-NS
MATVADLRAQADALLRQAEEQEAAERAKLFDGILKKLSDAGVGVEELAEFARPKKAAKQGSNFEPRYKNPEGETWSGRGHQPQWLKDAIAAGKTKEDFAIK